MLFFDTILPCCAGEVAGKEKFGHRMSETSSIDQSVQPMEGGRSLPVEDVEMVAPTEGDHRQLEQQEYDFEYHQAQRAFQPGPGDTVTGEMNEEMWEELSPIPLVVSRDERISHHAICLG